MSTGGGTPGGGATDLRTIKGTGGATELNSWDDKSSLRSRVIVAAGGGSVYSNANSTGYGYAGGLTGYSVSGPYNGGTHTKTGGTQTSGGTGGDHNPGSGQTNGCYAGYTDTPLFGIAASCGATGGNGWYPGAGGLHATGSGAGGSSYISGHTGSVAVTSTSSSSPKSGCITGTTNNACSISPYGYTFTNTVMIDGAGYKWTNTKGSLQAMPNPSGGTYASGKGHTGNGYAKITWLGDSI